MSVQKAREQVLWELLQEYKRKFRPIYMSLVAKEIFLDIMNIEQKDLTYGKNEIPFTEEEWYKFKDALIKGFKLKNFNQFISIYFKNGPKFEFESNFRDCVAEFEWWIKTGSIGQTYFQKPGAIMLRDVDDFWVFLLFSHDQLIKRSYNVEITALTQLVDTINKCL